MSTFSIVYLTAFLYATSYNTVPGKTIGKQQNDAVRRDTVVEVNWLPVHYTNVIEIPLSLCCRDLSWLSHLYCLTVGRLHFL
jgi:hypothetical protein